MRPARKLACAVLALAVVTSVVYATGAFTSTTASRSADVEVAGYGAAFLALQPSDGPNGAFASYGSNGALQVSIGGARKDGTGVNPDSQTVFRDVFTITNKGSQPVSVWLTGGSPTVTFVGPDGTSIEGESGAVTLSPGGRSLHIGLVIDTRGVPPGANLLESVTIHTDASGMGMSAPAAAQRSDERASAERASDTSKSRGSGPVVFSGGDSRPKPGNPRYYRLRNPIRPDSSGQNCVIITTAINTIPVVGAVTGNDIEDCDGSSGSSDNGRNRGGDQNGQSSNSVKSSSGIVFDNCIPGELIMSDENEREWCKASANDMPGTSTNPYTAGAKMTVTLALDLEKTFGDEIANTTENADEVHWIDGDGDGENDIDELQEILNIDNDSDDDDDDDNQQETWPFGY